MVVVAMCIACDAIGNGVRFDKLSKSHGGGGGDEGGRGKVK